MDTICSQSHLQKPRVTATLRQQHNIRNSLRLVAHEFVRSAATVLPNTGIIIRLSNNKNVKKLTFVSILVCLSFAALSQELHSPAEILKIMENSSVMYELDMLTKSIPCPDRSDLLNSNDLYRVTTDSSIVTYHYNLKSEALPYFEQAEAFFTQRDLDSAMYYYEKVLEIDPSYYKVMTYIGQIYGTMKNFDLSKSWYKKSIESNYIDYMAHWFLADIYKMQGRIDSAVNEITIAMILNRNNPRIKIAQSDIYKLAKIKTNDWCFTPQVEISKENNRVKIKLDENWVGYGMAKALWLYEPGYKQSMGVEENHYSSLEDRECLLNLMVGLINAKTNIKNNPGLTTLKQAIENDYLNEYIFYEILLPDHPNVAYQLSNDFISRIKDYVLNIRYQ